MGWRWDSIPEGQSEGQRRRLEREEDAAIRCDPLETDEERVARLMAAARAACASPGSWDRVRGILNGLGARS